MLYINIVMICYQDISDSDENHLRTASRLRTLLSHGTSLPCLRTQIVPTLTALITPRRTAGATTYLNLGWKMYVVLVVQERRPSVAAFVLR